MANAEQLEILKQGVKVWNEWRANNRSVDAFGRVNDLQEVDLRGADLNGAKLWRADFHNAVLTEANLSKAHLFRANLREAELGGADLSNAYLLKTDISNANFSGAILSNAVILKADVIGCDLSKAHLNGAFLWGSDLSEARLIEADLQGADLKGANLWRADLRKANLSASNLVETDLREADLEQANLQRANLSSSNLGEANLREVDFGEAVLRGSIFSNADVDATSFINSDLSEVIGLEDVFHRGPSLISPRTFSMSKGKIRENFLRGCGLNDWEVEIVKLYNPDLSNEEINNIQYKMYDLRATQAFQISPLFVSYSHADGEFIDKISKSLTEKGIRYWRDIHDMKAGRLEEQIDRAIRHNPIVLLVLSERSLNSDWVEHEVRTARELEKDTKRDVLCPVALDDSWKSSRWPRRIMEQIMEYNILDFSEWQDDNKFDSMFRKLIDGLELFYKG